MIFVFSDSGLTRPTSLFSASSRTLIIVCIYHIARARGEADTILSSEDKISKTKIGKVDDSQTQSFGQRRQLKRRGVTCQHVEVGIAEAIPFLGGDIFVAAEDELIFKLRWFLSCFREKETTPK